MEFCESQADHYFHAFFERFREIADQPLLYPAVDEIREGYRRSPCGVDSIYYRIVDDSVEIMAIIGRQNLDAWLSGSAPPRDDRVRLFAQGVRRNPVDRPASIEERGIMTP